MDAGRHCRAGGGYRLLQGAILDGAACQQIWACFLIHNHEPVMVRAGRDYHPLQQRICPDIPADLSNTDWVPCWEQQRNIHVSLCCLT